MDGRLLSYYDRELSYLRELGSEFARDYPKVAGQLGLVDGTRADPQVERLLEGFAFLAARVQLAIDAEFPRFTEQLLDLIHPQALAPTPALAIARFAPNPRQSISAQGFRVPRGTRLHAELPARPGATCRFRTAHELTIWPLEVCGLSHQACSLPPSSAASQLLGKAARAVRGELRLRLRTLDGRPFSALALDRLPLFIPLRDAAGRRLFDLCHGAALGVQLRADHMPPVLRARESLAPLGFDDEQALLPVTARSFQGYRLLQEWFALPERFSFVELRDLAPALRDCHQPEIEIAVLLDRHDPVLELELKPSHVQLFCSPISNLFEHRADRIVLSDRSHEYHVQPDRTRPGDFEVHSVLEVLGHGDRGEPPRAFLPFYASTARTREPGSAGYFGVHRRPRATPPELRNRTLQPGYAGSETYLSLVDGDAGPYRSSLRQLTVKTLCTNRDLPLLFARESLGPALQLEVASPVSEVRCVAGPSAPRASTAWSGTCWRLITQLSCNYLSLAGDGGTGAEALRELLLLHADAGCPVSMQQVRGVRSLSSAPVVRRLPVPGPASFGRGLELRLECDDAAFEGGSLLAFGLVLDSFFARFASINSFTELVLHGSNSGQLARFPARLGRRLSL